MQRYGRIFRNTALVFSTAVCLVLMVLGRYGWAFGFLAASLWSLASLLLTLYILRVALVERKKGSLPLALLVKFPLLYALGLAVAVFKVFPSASLLAGVSAMFVIFAGVRICMKPL